jgi:hypothetical protein
MAHSTPTTYSWDTLARWDARRTKLSVRLQTYIDQVLTAKHRTLSQRVRIAGNFLQDRVVANLSRPVYKYRSSRTGRNTVAADSRSKPGEFPRADTTRLLKDIFHQHDPDTATSRVGTTLLYGLVLETQLDRSFLRRTLNEMRAQLILIIQGGHA